MLPVPLESSPLRVPSSVPSLRLVLLLPPPSSLSPLPLPSPPIRPPPRPPRALIRRHGWPRPFSPHRLQQHLRCPVYRLWGFQPVRLFLPRVYSRPDASSYFSERSASSACNHTATLGATPEMCGGTSVWCVSIFRGTTSP